MSLKYFTYVWVNKFRKHEKKKKTYKQIQGSVYTNLNHKTTCNPLFRLRVFIFGIFSRGFRFIRVARWIVITFFDAYTIRASKHSRSTVLS